VMRVWKCVFGFWFGFGFVFLRTLLVVRSPRLAITSLHAVHRTPHSAAEFTSPLSCLGALIRPSNSWAAPTAPTKCQDPSTSESAVSTHCCIHLPLLTMVFHILHLTCSVSVTQAAHTFCVA
jgi:hypothetical protein